MTTVDQDPLDLDESGLASIGKHWGLVLALGITSIIVGIIAVVWPGATIVVIAILVAAWLIVSGIFQIVRGFGRGLSGGMRALLFISGALSLILGLFAISGVSGARSRSSRSSSASDSSSAASACSSSRPSRAAAAAGASSAASSC